MYGFGFVACQTSFVWLRLFSDKEEPLEESVDLLEEMVVDYIIEMVCYSLGATTYTIRLKRQHKLVQKGESFSQKTFYFLFEKTAKSMLASWSYSKWMKSWSEYVRHTILRKQLDRSSNPPHKHTHTHKPHTKTPIELGSWPSWFSIFSVIFFVLRLFALHATLWTFV